MKFINESDLLINLNINKEWQNVQPGEIIDLPHYIGDRQEGLSRVDNFKEVEVVEEPNIILDKSKLLKWTKDKLNDHAAKIGLEEVNTSMKKEVMVDMIIKYISEKDE